MNLYEFSKSPNARKAIVALLGLLVVVLALTKMIFVAVLATASFFLSAALGFFRFKSIGLELVTFVTVLAGIAYGPMTGAVVGLLLIIVHMAVSQYVGAYILWVVPEYFVAGLLTGVFAGSVPEIGMAIVITLNAFNILMTVLTYRQNLSKYLIYSGTNIIFNAALFALLGPGLVAFMKG